MEVKEIKKLIRSDVYNFLKTDKSLNKNIILLCLGGSHAYGTNTQNSDLDVRGITLNQKRDILTNQKFDQFINNETDTVIYSFNKIINLLSSCNPNTIEMLGLKKDHYLYLHPLGQELLDNKKMFLSTKAAYSFGGYAEQQLRRLSNKSNRLVSQSDQERYILNTIENAMYYIKEAYQPFADEEIILYIDKAVQENYDSEIFMDVNIKHYPLRDYSAIWNEMKSIVSSYSKIGKRNEKAIEHNKLGKHMMHLLRLYMMAIDILENEEIITYREKEHDLLMDIRNGKYLDNNKQPIPEFNEMLNQYKKRFDYAKENTSLSNKPNYKQIMEFQSYVNEKIVKGDF